MPQLMNNYQETEEQKRLRLAGSEPQQQPVAAPLPTPSVEPTTTTSAPEVEEPAISVPEPQPTQMGLVTSGVESTVTAPVVTPELNKAEADVRATTEAAIQAVKKEEDLKVEKAKIQAESAEKQRIERDKALADKALRDAEYSRQEKADLAEIEADKNAFKGAKITDYYEGKTGKKIMAAFAIGLGHIAGGMDGTNQNRALEIINANIARDLEIQKENVKKLADNLKASRDFAGDRRTLNADLEARLEAQAAGKITSIADEFQSRLIAQGVPEAEASSNKVVANLRAQAAEKEAAAARLKAGTRNTKVEKKLAPVDASGQPVAAGTKPEKITEGEGKVRGFLVRKVAAVKDYDKAGGLSPEDADRIRKHRIQNSIDQRIPDGVGGYVVKQVIKPGVDPIPKDLSPSAKKAWNALQELARAQLRQESGAAIGVQEELSELEQYMPQAGDTADVIAQKRKNMTRRLAADQQQLTGGAKINIPKEPDGSRPSGGGQQSSELSAKEQEALDWANANPKDPRSAKIKERLGR